MGLPLTFESLDVRCSPIAVAVATGIVRRRELAQSRSRITVYSRLILTYDDVLSNLFSYHTTDDMPGIDVREGEYPQPWTFFQPCRMPAGVFRCSLIPNSLPPGLCVHKSVSFPYSFRTAQRAAAFVWKQGKLRRLPHGSRSALPMGSGL